MENSQPEGRRCDSCLNYENNSILGHFNCSAHRDCAGELGWNPENCEICLQFKENYALMNTEERNSALKSLKWMLKRMQKNFSTEGFSWEFLNIRDNFLEENINSPQPSLGVSVNSLNASLSINTPRSVLSVVNTINQEITNKKEDSEKEGKLYELLNQMFSGFNKISSELSENMNILTELNND